MLYAVSVETSRAIRHGRMRRRERVYVDARDGDEARALALQRFRHLRRNAFDPPRVAVVHAVDLEKPRPPLVASPAPRPQPKPKPKPKPTKPRRPKRRQRKRGAPSR